MKAISKLNKILCLILMSISWVYAQPNGATLKYKQQQDVVLKLQQLEQSFGGRIGVYALNMHDHATVSYRNNERFAMCSTAKLIVVTTALKKSESQPKYLDKVLSYNEQDLAQADYTPITSKYLDKGMNVKDLSEAAMIYSDNLAMNLLVKDLGGTSVVTKYARSIGDKKFRLDRIEPGFGSAIPNDPRDTTTPESMALSLQKILLKNVLNKNNRHLLLTWMKNNQTGFTRIRAGVPKGWVVADKTGKGDYGTNNDIAIIYPPDSAPIILAIYTTQSKQDAKSNDEVIVAVTKIVLEELLSDDYSCKLS